MTVVRLAADDSTRTGAGCRSLAVLADVVVKLEAGGKAVLTVCAAALLLAGLSRGSSPGVPSLPALLEGRNGPATSSREGELKGRIRPATPREELLDTAL